jgi:parallel beta-helix repeat protein
LKKQLFVGIVVTLLILNTLTFLFTIQPARGEPGTLRVPTDYATIQGAINAAHSGDTVYVYNGVYHENVVVNKTLSLVGENRSLTIVDGGGAGHVIHVTQGNVNVTGFTLRNALGNQSGIVVENAGNCFVTGNNIVNNSAGGSAGIALWNSSGNVFAGNNLTSNTYGLIFLGGSGLNSIYENNIANNIWYGVYLDHSGNNTFYHNNFVNNTNNVLDNVAVDSWDAGYPSGGNYWSTYNGTDVNHGPSQDQPGSDGIGDSPYIIDESNRDHFPLMKTWNAGSTLYAWPTFRGNPTGTGYTEGPGSRTNRTLWSYITGNWVYSTPAVVGGRIYFGSIDFNIYCLDELSGARIWNYTTGGDVYSSPAVVDGKVYVGSEDNKIYCLDASSGTRIWSYTTGDDVLSSPTVVGGKVYVGSRDFNIYCLDELSGARIWNYTTEDLVDSSPAVAYGRVYVGSNHGEVYCFDALTGTILWIYNTYAYYVDSSPAVSDGKVFVGSGIGKVYCLDAMAGTLTWASQLSGSVLHSSPAVAYGKVYICSWDNNTYCLDALTGAQIWNYTTGDNRMETSPAVADGKVYFGSGDDNVYCLDAVFGGLVWKYKTSSYVFSSPAIADGVVFIGSWDHGVYAIGAVIRVPEDYKTIQGAIDAANPGDTITIAPSIYHESLIINKTLTILGRMGSEPVFAGGGTGIAITLLSGASGTIVAGITITSWDQGVLIVNANNCEIYSTIMSQMNKNGITVMGTNAVNNNIYSNIFQNNAIAVNLTASSTSNTFYKNIIVSNVNVGLDLESSGNIIYANTISENYIGVNITNSNGNVIYHNDFIDNHVQTTLPSASNTWDNGYPSGGNYWSDYSGVDVKNGPNQDVVGSDGIYDAGYTIATNNKDRYPLTKPFNQHDIGMTNLYAKAVVNRGLCILLSVRILNYGMSSETFPVNCWANTTLATAQTATLAARNFTTVTVLWNTSGFALGRYIINASAGPVLGETDIIDNNMTGLSVTVSILGDLTGGTPNVWDFVPDGKCDGKDISVAAKCFGSYPECPQPLTWNANCDITGSIMGVPDGKVDGKDIAMVAKHFGEHE